MKITPRDFALLSCVGLSVMGHPLIAAVILILVALDFFGK